MRKKILIVGLIGLLMAWGLVLAGCNAACPRGGDCTVSIDSTGKMYDGFAYCSNSDCAATKYKSPGKHTCSCH